MTLDLLQIAPQVGAMAQEVGTRRRAMAWRRDRALALLTEWDTRLDALRALVQREQPWLVAEPLEPLRTAHAAPALPPEVTVVATDGSAIDLDRHGLAQCYLVNVGAAVIRYGVAPVAALTSRAALYFRDDDLFLDDQGTRVPIQGALADLKRTLAEQARALELARAVQDTTGGPVVAVADGTLLLWQLAGRAAEEAFVAAAIAAYAAGLEEFRRLGIPVCSYVSRPNGHEVVNLLRLAACPEGPDPHAQPSRDAYPGGARAVRPVSLPDGGEGGAAAAPLALREGARAPWRQGDEGCAQCARGQCLRDALQALPDRAVMGHLRPGDRSARFASRSPVLRHYGPRGSIQFVYLNVGAEVARLEVPAWVGDDPALLDLVHATVYDGCARGWGYPPALAEAHEQAVIRGDEREAFLRMVMEALNVEGQPAEWSAKRLSKNRRAV